jgi:hypothetical protein
MRRPAVSDISVLWTREFQIDLRPLVRLARERPEAVVVGLGVALRVLTYLLNRPMWLDEGSLKANVVDVPVFKFSEPLTNDQLAPLGFLVVERILASVVSSRNYVLRFLPLAAGIGALYLFRALATHLLSSRAALVALVLFALSDDLIYYSSEFKPYSLDLFFGVAITLAAVSALGRTPPTRTVACLAALTVFAPWFSFSSAFTVAGCGTVLILDAVLAGRLQAALLWVGIGVGWLANFMVSLQASRAMLSSATTMYRFWGFTFLPSGASARDLLLWATGQALEVFVNPLNLLCPGDSQLGVVLPLSLLLVGAFSMARRSIPSFLLLVTPIIPAVAATVLHYFPFHGRLILELVPALFLLIAQGTEWIDLQFPSRSHIAYRTVLIALFTYPCWDACYRSSFWRDRVFNIHGDLHRNVFIDRPATMPPPALRDQGAAVGDREESGFLSGAAAGRHG